MPEVISGSTRVFGILADPIHHVQTPQMLNALMRARGFDGVLVPMHITPQELNTFVDGLRCWRNFGGFIATVPHKPRMLELCDEVSQRARSIGAANTIRREPDGRLVADMLDGQGFIAGLRKNKIEPEGKKVFMAGAGGAGRAVAFGLAEAGAAALTISNRSAARAAELKARLNSVYPGLRVSLSSDPADHALAVNTTSLGMREDDPLPFDVGRVDQEATVAEIIMQPEITPVLAAARARGLKTHLGKPMLACQIELMAQFLGISEKR